MGNTIKPLSRLLLLAILISGLCLLVLANCSIVKGGYKPSAPEFSLDVVESSYYVPPTFKIDQYTGKNVTEKQGYTVEKKPIYMTIKNQAFPHSVNGTRCHMAYNIAFKGHFGEEWKGLDFESKYTMTRYLSDGFPKASNSDYTVLYVCSANNYPADTQLDIKVQAYIGHEAVIHVIDYLPDHAFPVYAGEHDEDGIIFDTPGDWSEIQTITINVSPPEILLISIQNETYTEDSVNLDFSVNKGISWMGYSLDGQSNVTLTENTVTLTGLTNGLHTLTIYAEGTYPDTETSKTITFNINEESTQVNFTVNMEPEQLNIILIGALILIPIAACLGTLIYLHRIKHSVN